MSISGKQQRALPERTESDFLGQVQIPAGAYWGAHTARAVQNFAVSGITIGVYPELVAALGSVKQAAARSNADLGLLDPEVARAIDDACGLVQSGTFDDQFVVDVLQGGAGTSTNMNANEVIANLALASLGHPAGAYHVVHPLDDVNRSQSTNDVYPTAVKIALLNSLDGLSSALDLLVATLRDRATRFAAIPKIGRTQLQDAVPMTVGQEFASWADTLAEEEARLRESRSLLIEINLGATAIGTGITADPTYAAAVCAHLREITGLPLVTAPNLIEATSDTGVFVQLSSTLKRTAVKVSKLCNDLRLLASGPQAGLGELLLPPRQAGSSIMPGKVNPVIPEMVNQVAFAVIGADTTITLAAQGGQLQLNAFEPVMAHTLLQEISWMGRAFELLAQLCIADIEVDAEKLTAQSASSAGLATALTPYVGYAAAAQIAKAALAGDGTVRDLALAGGLIAPADLDEALDVRRLAGIRPESAD